MAVSRVISSLINLQAGIIEIRLDNSVRIVKKSNIKYEVAAVATAGGEQKPCELLIHPLHPPPVLGLLTSECKLHRKKTHLGPPREREPTIELDPLYPLSPSPSLSPPTSSPLIPSRRAFGIHPIRIRDRRSLVTFHLG